MNDQPNRNRLHLSATINNLAPSPRRSTMKRLYGILLLGAILITGFASNTLALTAACTTITNQATLAYSVGGVLQADILSDGDPVAAGVQTTDFTVDSKVDLTVSTFNSPVTATGINQILTY